MFTGCTTHGLAQKELQLRLIAEVEMETVEKKTTQKPHKKKTREPKGN